MRLFCFAVAGAVALWTGSAAAAGAGDPAKGETVFKKCTACHNLDKPPKNGIGPSLVGLVGRKAGSVEGFKYSDAMKGSNIVWDEQTIDAYLKDPKGYIPKNKMVFVGLPKDSDRADVIAFLKTAK
jgi:cytochrome c